MPRLLHMADVHLGARHQDLGQAAAEQRERQFDAFRRALDLALAEHVDVVLVAGDLFDSNQQPRRSVERAAAELGRLPAAGAHVVVIPGTHDVYDHSSLYRIHDLAALAGVKPGGDGLVVLTPERPEVVFPALDLVVYGRVFDTKRAPRSPLAGFSAAEETRARWRVGLVHGSLRIEGKIEADDVLFTTEEITNSGLDYLALGHWHSFQQGRAGGTTWAYAGAPEPVAVDQDGAGQVILVELEDVGGDTRVRLEPRQIGRTKFLRLDIDAAEVASQPAIVERIRRHADPDLVIDVRLVGIEPDSLDLNEDEVERQLAGAFLRHRFRNEAAPAPVAEALPPPDTIPGAFMRDLEERIAQAESSGQADQAAELREALRLGRILLDDPSRVTLV
ncbi:MAG: metallophosphoesterase family protein [Candidatus Limnocylindrales bacterium]